jgi:hypothetical protein
MSFAISRLKREKVWYYRHFIPVPTLPVAEDARTVNPMEHSPC